VDRYKSFGEFYPYYLSEHRKKGTRITHFVGTTFFFLWVISAIVNQNGWHILYGAITAYFFAWLGHFFIEKNKPATFQYPLMSLRGDFLLYFQLLSGKEKFSA
jgi:hypothetical protein